MTVSIEGMWRIFEDRLPIVIYTAHCFVSIAQFGRCVPSDMKIMATSVCPPWRVDLTSVSTSSSSGISSYLSLPALLCSVNFGIQAFRWHIAVEATLRGINMMLSVSWVPQQPCHAFDDVSTPVFDTALVIVILFHILDSV